MNAREGSKSMNAKREKMKECRGGGIYMDGGKENQNGCGPRKKQLRCGWPAATNNSGTKPLSAATQLPLPLNNCIRHTLRW
jgi:hypothetical protein